MGLSTETNQVTWSAANTKSVAASGTEDADDYTFDVTCSRAMLQIKADNSGTPASGDIANLYAALKGDPDQDTTDEYDSVQTFVTSLDTYNDADPAVKSMPFYPIAGQTYQFSIENEGASAMTCSIRITEEKVS